MLNWLKNKFKKRENAQLVIEDIETEKVEREHVLDAKETLEKVYSKVISTNRIPNSLQLIEGIEDKFNGDAIREMRLKDDLFLPWKCNIDLCLCYKETMTLNIDPYCYDGISEGYFKIALVLTFKKKSKYGETISVHHELVEVFMDSDFKIDGIRLPNKYKTQSTYGHRFCNRSDEDDTVELTYNPYSEWGKKWDKGYEYFII